MRGIIRSTTFYGWVSRPLLLSLVLLATVAPGLAQPEPEVMRGFVLQTKAGPCSTVIETPEELARFIACLPADLPQKREPAAPNPDPLRQKGFSLDFSRQVLAVVVHRDTISAFPEFRGVQGDLVMFDVPGRPPEARPYDWGVYTAVILPRGKAWKIEQKAVDPVW